jgi:DNA helicase-2/ATP-dependent DNA helicase PcrA
VEPLIAGYADGDSYARALREAVRGAREAGGLAAVIAANPAQVKALLPLFGDEAPIVLDRDTGMPASGVVLVDVALAKGLEFDCVIVPDAQADVYGTDALSRRRLYTAISRATQKVEVLALGQLSPLLA